jgi:DNA (cytosine-5)-methyltransferase 1
MLMKAYYNEIDRFCCDWLSNLMDAKLITPGKIDDRSIIDVRPDDLTGFERAHFFAGIGGWDRALNIAGWSGPVWTGSCPCPPFSSAARGRRAGFDDPRDLWPTWHSLIAAIAPGTIFGEQVAHGSAWIDRASDGLEALGYEVGAAVLPAVGIGKDHTRHRIYFVGYANGDREPSVRLNGEMAWLRRDRSDARGVVSADGLPSRMAVFSAFGNAIIPDLAAEFIGATMNADPALSFSSHDGKSPA